MKGYNIYQRKDGRFEGRISRGKDKDGKRRFGYVFGKTRNEVKNVIDKIIHKEQNGKCNKTVSELFFEWHKSIRLKVKESTSANYLTKAEKHILPSFGNRLIDSITVDDIYNFMESKKKAGLSIRYISDIIILMKSLFKYAVKSYNILNIMTKITLPKKKKSEIRILDNNEQKKLENYIGGNPNMTTMGIALTMVTGIRIGELCALQWEDIDLEKRILTVKKTIQRIQIKNSNTRTKLVITEPKSESSNRKIPIPACIINMLKKFKGNKKDYIISGTENPLEPRTIQYRFSKILKNVKLPSIHFHALRHMFATNCIKLGFDIKSLSEILGHSSVEVTLNKYVHSSFEQKTEYMKKINFIF